MLKQSLQQKLLQKLSPQQIQLMKLLQLPTMELEVRIKEELEANPALEEGAEQEWDDDDLSVALLCVAVRLSTTGSVQIRRRLRCVLQRQLPPSRCRQFYT